MLRRPGHSYRVMRCSGKNKHHLLINCASSHTGGSTCGQRGKVHELRGTCGRNTLAGNGVGGENCGGFLSVSNRIGMTVGCSHITSSSG